jgi:hypothetical protein
MQAATVHYRALFDVACENDRSIDEAVRTSILGWIS